LAAPAEGVVAPPLPSLPAEPETAAPPALLPPAALPLEPPLAPVDSFGVDEHDSSSVTVNSLGTRAIAPLVLLLQDRMY
jgi:hypothetical protein